MIEGRNRLMLTKDNVLRCNKANSVTIKFMFPILLACHIPDISWFVTSLSLGHRRSQHRPEFYRVFACLIFAVISKQ